jgi:hypothetical protein
VHWRRWVTRTWRTTQKESRDGWRQVTSEPHEFFAHIRLMSRFSRTGSRETSLGRIQHGPPHTFGGRHVVQENHFPQWIEGSHQSLSRAIPSGLGANAVKRLNLGRAKQVHSFECHLQERVFRSAFYSCPHEPSSPRAVGFCSRHVDEVHVGLSLARVRATEIVRSYVNRRYAASFIPTAETPRQKKHAS